MTHWSEIIEQGLLMKTVIDGLKLVVGLAWPAVILAVVLIFRDKIHKLLTAFVSRFERDDVIKLGSIEFKGVRIRSDRREEQRGQDVVDDIGNIKLVAATQSDFENRKKFRYENRFTRLVHRVFASDDKDYPYKIVAYVKIEEIDPALSQDKGFVPARINDIDFIEYYLGKYFGPGEWGSWFILRNAEDRFAIEYLTKDEVTCIARVHFHGGGVAELHRYLDIEMGEIILNLEDSLKAKTDEIEHLTPRKAG